MSSRTLTALGVALAAAGVLSSHPSSLVRAAGQVEAARALLAAGKYQEAADRTNAVLRELRATPAGAALVGPSFQALQGEFFVRTGQDVEKGRALLRQALSAMRTLPGPDNWILALFALEAAGRAARDAGDWELADWAAGQIREHDANYAGTHYALGLVAEHRGDTATAQTAFARAEQLWAAADSQLSELTALRSRRSP